MTTALAELSPFMKLSGFLLFVLLSILVQVAVAKWRQEKRRAEQKRAAAEAQRGKPR